MKANPFSTRQVAPGRLPWFADDSAELERLILRFNAFNRRAAILGPHGSGKSTLLYHLMTRLGGPIYIDAPVRPDTNETSPRGNLIWLQLRRPEAARKVAKSRSVWRAEQILVLDGFEQLNFFNRMRIQLATRRTGMGLLVTSHRPVWGLPSLAHLQVDPSLAGRIVRHLIGQSGCTADCDTEMLGELLQSHRGNFREVLMDLYDRY